MSQGIPGIHGVVWLMKPAIPGIRAVVGLMMEGILDSDGLMPAMPVVQPRSLAVASASGPLTPRMRTCRCKMPRLIARLTRCTAWTTASLVQPRY
jgi:hypothetical protein